jgi:hypothetical protein
MQKPSVLMATLLVMLPFLAGASLPSKGPVPPTDPRPAQTAEEGTASVAPPESTVPVPEEKPVSDTPEEVEERPAAEPAGSPSQPSSTPTTRAEPPGHPAKDFDLGGTSALGDAFRSEIEIEDPKAYAACIADLKAIGATFSEAKRIEDGSSCGIDRPVEVEALLPGVRLVPKAVLRCETALQTARLTRNLLIPAAKAALPDRPALTEVHQASAYICRNRNSAETGRLSEHARGNGIDISALRFGDEVWPLMIAKQDDGTAEAAFQRAFNALACLYFTTVLSPGSDAAHADHMHLDVIERKSGYRYCR